MRTRDPGREGRRFGGRAAAAPTRARHGAVRTALHAWVVAASLAALGACGSLLPERSAQTYYRLDDATPRPPKRGQTMPHAAVIAPISSNAVGNSYGMIYSRVAGERAYYQYNEWTDRPTLRVAQLLLERLDARGTFASVAQIGSGVAGDVLVNLVVDDAVHDLSSGGAGLGRIAVLVEVVDRRDRRLLGRRTFTESSPAQTANAAGGAAAINRAVTAFLDAASAWIEAVAEGAGK